MPPTVPTHPGLAIEGRGPVNRRAALRDLSPSQLGERIAAMALALRAPGAEAYRPLAEAVGLPLGEVVASPFALRACVMAAEVGASVVDHELRAQISWPQQWLADGAVVDEHHATWDRGVLRVGKYQSFLQDEPLSSFNPNHMAKWGPHELLHRVCRFFWSPGMSRWELYLGARLNEVVPVVMWYGPDEVLRLDREGFDRARDAADRVATVARAQWLELDEVALHERCARDAARLMSGIDHLERELSAVDEEMATGRQRAIPCDGLDSASDAAAYVVGHWRRLTHPGTRQLIGLLLPDVHYCNDILDYRRFVESRFDRLLFSELRWNPVRARARRSGRHLWDWLQRAVMVDRTALSDRLVLHLHDAELALASAVAGKPVDLAGWRTRLSEALNPTEAAKVLADGDAGWDEEQLDEGLRSVAPAACALLEGTERLEEALDAVAHAPAFRQRRPLAHRAIDALPLDTSPQLIDLLRFEQALADSRQRDDQVEWLCTRRFEDLPDDFEGGLIVANRGFRLLRLSSDAVALHAAIAGDGGDLGLPRLAEVAYLVGAWHDTVAVIPAPCPLDTSWAELVCQPCSVAEIMKSLSAITRPQDAVDGWPDGAHAWLAELLAAGAVGWVPRVASR